MKKIILTIVAFATLQILGGCDKVTETSQWNEPNSRTETEPDSTAEEILSDEPQNCDECESLFQENLEIFEQVVDCLQAADLPYGITIDMSADAAMPYDLYGKTVEITSIDGLNSLLSDMKSIGVLSICLDEDHHILFILSRGLGNGSYVQGIMYAKDYTPNEMTESVLIDDWYWISVPST